jgi:hypothetical protein
MQNIPVNAEKIRREFIRRSSSFARKSQLRAPCTRQSIRYLSSGVIGSTGAEMWNGGLLWELIYALVHCRVGFGGHVIRASADTLITFDDLSSSAGYNGGIIPTGYANLNWSNPYSYRDGNPNGYVTRLIIAFNGLGQPALRCCQPPHLPWRACI